MGTKWDLYSKAHTQVTNDSEHQPSLWKLLAMLTFEFFPFKNCFPNIHRYFENTNKAENSVYRTALMWKTSLLLLELWAVKLHIFIYMEKHNSKHLPRHIYFPRRIPKFSYIQWIFLQNNVCNLDLLHYFVQCLKPSRSSCMLSVWAPLSLHITSYTTLRYTDIRCQSQKKWQKRKTAMELKFKKKKKIKGLA